ncbi:hypothetical protein CR513_09584, partial [Mucuna pruriens]
MVLPQPSDSIRSLAIFRLILAVRCAQSWNIFSLDSRRSSWVVANLAYLLAVNGKDFQSVRDSGSLVYLTWFIRGFVLLGKSHGSGHKPIDSKGANNSKAFINFLDIDSCQQPEDWRPWSVEDLKEKTRIGAALDGELEECLVHFLTKTWDVFAWTLADMLGIDPNFLCHHLSIAPRTRLGEEKQKATKEETNKLLGTHFIRQFGKWRVCTNYTDLNKACLKDLYPLPSIDRLVDGASGYRLLSVSH